MNTSRFFRQSVLGWLLIVGCAWGRDALERPTEMLYWDSSRAYNGYTLFGVRGATYLLDMGGRVVHTWRIGTNPHLLDNGHILDAATDDPSGFGGFKELDWNGAVVWQYTDARSTYHPHHDFTRIFNPKLQAYTTLYIANKDLTTAQCVAAGATNVDQKSGGIQMDAIVEVDMAGKVVWEWCFFDHLVQDLDPTKSNYVGAGKTIADHPGRLNINLPGKPLRRDWLHCNSLDYSAELDQIVINSVQGEFYVIDHGGTFIAGNPTASVAKAASSAGDFLYRFGDPARYEQGDPPAILEDWTQSTTGHKQLGGAHDVQWIAPGLPGAGHFLIFDNAQYLCEHTPQSYVLEINPCLNDEGNDAGSYVNPPEAGYSLWEAPVVTDKTPKHMSKQIVWSYSSLSNLTLFSHIGCSAQRLPNGNTLICADTEGYITEVTAEGRVVWEYIVPVTPSGIVQVIGDNLPMVNSIFRAYRYGPDHPALAGRTLTPGKTIAGRTEVANPYADTEYHALQRSTELQYWDPAKACEGYTLFGAQGTSYLIDMRGQVVRTWPIATNPRLLTSGNLLDITMDANEIGGLMELDWNGTVVWQHQETRPLYHLHDDFARIFNKKLGARTTLYLAAKSLTHEQCIAAGCDPAGGPYTDARTEAIVEVDADGNVVWEWCFFDHAIQDIDASKANYVGTGKRISNYPGRINLNLPGRPIRSDWLHCNSLDYSPDLDQIVVNCEQGEFYVIDHGETFVVGDPAASIAKAATSAGDFLYRFGDPAMYGQGNPPSVAANWDSATNGNKQIGASNNVQWITAGLPGAGHLLVFSNNQYLFQRTPQSYVLEINPFLNSGGTDTGAYVNPPTAGYTQWTFDKDTHKSTQQLSKQVVWKYGSVSNLTLFSQFGSSAQRLPNGNTLICATTQGYMVEVTSSGQVVWEYINPVTNAGIVTSIGDALPMTNVVARAYRYTPDFAGFQGHDMTASRTITAGVAATSTTSTHEAVSAMGVNIIGTFSTAVLACLTAISSQASVPFDVVLGRPTDRSITVNVLGPADLQVYVEYDSQPGVYSYQTSVTNLLAGQPLEVVLDQLQPDSQYYCRLRFRASGETEFNADTERAFHTQRSPGSTFTFCIQGDSHPERVHKQFNADLYIRTLQTAAADRPDFYIAMGDDFSVDSLKTVNAETVRALYVQQRQWLGQVGSPLFLVNGNHEQAAAYLLDGTPDNVAVWAQTARNACYPQPAPDAFYSGDAEPVEFIGLLRDYYAWTWGDALFAVIDPYWHSPQAVDNQFGVDRDDDNKKQRDLWNVTLGDTQYQWFKKTIEESTAKYKFVFAHHVNGTGRGGIELAGLGEWGGRSKKGVWEFDAKRPGWGKPIHRLMADNHVTIFFQGHDHVFVRQELDGVIYQTLPEPADPNYALYFSDAYLSGDKLPNSGYTRVTVSQAGVKVDYVRTFLPADEGPGQTSGMVAYTYTAASSTAAPAPQASAPTAPGLHRIIAGILVAAEPASVSAAGAWSMQDLPDTGQTQSFTATFGEDADYTIHAPSFTDNGDGTVTDAVTGLIWQKADGGEMTWEAASAYAESLTLAGYTDWRLPTNHDIFRILNHGTSRPALDARIFTSSSAEYWWTMDTMAGDPSRVWVANAGGGLGPHPKNETLSAGGTKRFHVRCVRGAAPADTAVPRFIANGDGTVTDQYTGLVWQQAPANTAMSWEAALQYAEGLSLADHMDWRLPNIKELQSINDETRSGPSLDTTIFPGAQAVPTWSSTTEMNGKDRAWCVDFKLGIVSYQAKTSKLYVRCVRGGADEPTTQATSPASADSIPQHVRVPAGQFAMGDHHSFVDPAHPSDEVPIHTVSLDSFWMGTTPVTCSEYCAYLNAALVQGLIEVRSGYVYGVGGTEIYSDTSAADPASRIEWNGKTFAVRSQRDLHPITGIRWFGAAAYCNWASTRDGYEPCYNLTTGVCDFACNGYRLPTEAEWEYAARGGQQDPYRMFPWGDDTNADGTLANWPGSGDPYETGPYPWTTPVGFFNGQLHSKADFGWPGTQEIYQTRSNANGYGLYDMSGNVWQWVNDWYGRNYYQYCVTNSIAANPPGPLTGDPMPDGKRYRGLRGGNWFNGQDQYGHGRVANRDPSYYRGPGDPAGPWFHIGFRVVRRFTGVVAPGASLQQIGSGYRFTEGPAANAAGEIYFSDIEANAIYKWTGGTNVVVFRTDAGGANGLYFDAAGNLLICQGANKRVVSIDAVGGVTVLADRYNDAPFNKPNDLWVAPSGGVYFSDPLFGVGSKTQDGEHVYCVSADRTSVTRVISDMVRPNGLIGTPDGKTLYVADYGAGKVYRYSIGSDGTLSETLFASVTCDGMTLDNEGNVYMASDAVVVYDSSGRLIERIEVPEQPTNLTFGGADGRTLFITARTTIYTLGMSVHGAQVSSAIAEN